MSWRGSPAPVQIESGGVTHEHTRKWLYLQELQVRRPCVFNATSCFSALPCCLSSALLAWKAALPANRAGPLANAVATAHGCSTVKCLQTRYLCRGEMCAGHAQVAPLANGCNLSSLFRQPRPGPAVLAVVPLRRTATRRSSTACCARTLWRWRPSSTVRPDLHAALHAAPPLPSATLTPLCTASVLSSGPPAAPRRTASVHSLCVWAWQLPHAAARAPPPASVVSVVLPLPTLRPAAPTVGWACMNYHKLYRRPRGMYFSANDRGEMVGRPLLCTCANSFQAWIDFSKLVLLIDRAWPTPNRCNLPRWPDPRRTC